MLNVLQMCRPALAKKEIIEEAVRFIFTGDVVTAFNDELCVIHPFETDFQCSVNGEELFKILDGIKEEVVNITVEEDQMRVKSKRTRAGLSTIVGEKERVDKLIKKLQDATVGKGFWRRLPTNFIEGIVLCMFSASKDMTTGVRCCVAAKDDKIYSTDSVRISRFTMNGEVKELLIPARNAVELVKYPIKKYGKSEGWIHFLTDDNVMFNCRMMVGEYPYTIDRFFREPENEIVVPDDMKDVMKNAAIMATGDEVVAKMVEMKIEKGRILCRSEKDRGWLEKEIDFDYKGKVITFYINPIFFAQILEKATSLFLVRGEEFPDKAYFTRENFQHIVALPA